MNDKNRLQEYCQKRRMRLPIYTSVYDKCRGVWVCTVEIPDSDSKIECIGVTVRNAEQIAAQYLLNMFEQRDEKARTFVTSDKRVVVYIDMENVNVNEMRDLFSRVIYDDKMIKFVGFLSDNHHYSQTDFKFDGIDFKKVLVPSAMRDAVDIGMIMYSLCVRTHFAEYIMNECGKYDDCVIVSRDKFSHAFADLASKGFCGYTGKVVHASCIKTMEKCLGLTELK